MRRLLLRCMLPGCYVLLLVGCGEVTKSPDGGANIGRDGPVADAPTALDRSSSPDEGVALDRGSLDQSRPDATPPDVTIADQTIVDQTAADQTIADQTAVDRAIADQTAADQTVAPDAAAQGTLGGPCKPGNICDPGLICVSTTCAKTWVYGGGGSGDDRAKSVAADSTGNVYLAGRLGSPGATLGSAVLTSGGSSPVVVKVSPAGKVAWASTLSHNSSTANSGAEEVVVDTSGRVYVAGLFDGKLTCGTATSTASGSTDAFVAMLDGSTGACRWLTTFGSAAQDTVTGLAVDASGTPHIAGFFGGTVTFGSAGSYTSQGNSDIFVAKLQPSGGGFSWVRTAGGVESDQPCAMALSSAGEVYVTGLFRDKATVGTTVLNSAGSTSGDIFVAGYSSTGKALWAASAGGQGHDTGLDLAYAGTGALYVAGYFSKTASFGTLKPVSAGGRDLFVTRFNLTTKTFTWVIAGGSSGDDLARGVAVDARGRAVVVGEHEGAFSLGGKAVGLNGTTDGYVARLDSTGKVEWVSTASASGNHTAPYSVARSAVGIIVAGAHPGNTVFGPTGSLAALPSNGSYDLFSWFVGVP